MLRLAFMLALSVVVGGCAAKLPPHVWIPINNLAGADLFWWTDTQQCNLRVFFEDWQGFKSFQVPTDASLCLEWLKAEGYAVPKGTP